MRKVNLRATFEVHRRKSAARFQDKGIVKGGKNESVRKELEPLEEDRE